MFLKIAHAYVHAVSTCRCEINNEQLIEHHKVSKFSSVNYEAFLSFYMVLSQVKDICLQLYVIKLTLTGFKSCLACEHN